MCASAISEIKNFDRVLTTPIPRIRFRRAIDIAISIHTCREQKYCYTCTTRALKKLYGCRLFTEVKTVRTVRPVTSFAPRCHSILTPRNFIYCENRIRQSAHRTARGVKISLASSIPLFSGRASPPDILFSEIPRYSFDLTAHT